MSERVDACDTFSTWVCARVVMDDWRDDIRF